MDNKKLWPEKSYPRESCTNNHNGDKPSAPPSTLIKKPPATKQKKWCKADDKKLRELVNQPGNNITLSRDTENLKLM
jgi:hypothetical protein